VKKNNPKIINAWCMYDWAVSVYNLTITSAIFPIYYANVAVNENGGDIINFLGFQVKNSVLYSYSISFSFFIIALISPILSAISDYSGRKKMYMQFFCLLGGLACALLYFFKTETTTFAIFMFILAGIGYSGSFIFYNSYLPDIATEDQFDRISARGFSYGYIGSVLLLIINLLMIMQPHLFGNISVGFATRLSFLSVGIWWILFAQYTFYYLPKDQPIKLNKNKSWLFEGFKKLKKVYSSLKKHPNIDKYLIAFFFYNSGVQTVMLVATVFAEKELNLPTSSLIITVLILQLIAILGATLFAKISNKIGNINTITVMILIWIGICGFAYFVQNGTEFYVLAAFVGFVMGGIQSLSRATYAKLLPENTDDTASFYSFYESVYSVSVIFGTFFYGITEDITNNARNSILVLTTFFILGLVLIRRIRKI
jgi:UMF1 family MFS transporter